MKKNLQLLVTLWPSFPHFKRFAKDSRLTGIRLNSAALLSKWDLEMELAAIKENAPLVPLFFDVKGRQPRVVEVNPNSKFLDVRLNHPISVNTPVEVLLKQESDIAVLDRLEEDGRRLVFKDGGRYGRDGTPS